MTCSGVGKCPSEVSTELIHVVSRRNLQAKFTAAWSLGEKMKTSLLGWTAHCVTSTKEEQLRAESRRVEQRQAWEWYRWGGGVAGWAREAREQRAGGVIKMFLAAVFFCSFLNEQLSDVYIRIFYLYRTHQIFRFCSKNKYVLNFFKRSKIRN